MPYYVGNLNRYILTDAGSISKQMRGALTSVVLFLTASGCDMSSMPAPRSPSLEPEPFTADENISTEHLSKWRVDQDETIVLPIVPAITGNDFTVDWGDGTIERFKNSLAEHTYAQKGTYTVKINGTAARWSFAALPYSRHNILAVSDFGALGWENLDGAFWQAESLTHLAGGDVSEVTSMRSAFAQASNVELDIGKWDTRQVNDMGAMFDGAISADPDVSNWDVSAVINMQSMFANTQTAQPEVSEWNISAVEDMRAMFAFSTAANPAVGKWDTANVRDMRAMFRGAIAADPDVSNWDITKVSRLDYMFADAVAANPNVSKWNTSNIISMRSMFSGAVSADPDVFSWDTSKVVTLAAMFKNAINASPRLMCWDVAKVVDMRGMFDGAVKLDADLSKWNFAKAVFMQDMFQNTHLSTESYDALIKQLAATAQQSNVIFNAGNSKYSCDAEPYRQQLIDRGWLIDDAGKSKPCEERES